MHFLNPKSFLRILEVSII